MGLNLYLLVYWVLFCLYFAVFPHMVLGSPIWQTEEFWGYLLFTGAYAYLVLAWMAMMSSMDSAKAVITNGIILCLLTQIHFMLVGLYAVETLRVQSLLSVLLGLLFTSVAYRRWWGMEFSKGR